MWDDIKIIKFLMSMIYVGHRARTTTTTTNHYRPLTTAQLLTSLSHVDRNHPPTRVSQSTSPPSPKFGVMAENSFIAPSHSQLGHPHSYIYTWIARKSSWVFQSLSLNHALSSWESKKPSDASMFCFDSSMEAGRVRELQRWGHKKDLRGPPFSRSSDLLF